VKNSRGVTLVETLTSIVLLSILLCSILGAFFVSKLSTAHARHRVSAMNILRSYIDYELAYGYDGVSDGDGFANPLVVSTDGTNPDPITVTIDDRGTVDTSDDLTGTVTAEPYFPRNLEDASGELYYYREGAYNYKIIGFNIQWNEDFFGRGQGFVCRERSSVYVARHP